MPRRLLPKEGTPEYQELIDEYQQADRGRLEKLARKWGFSSVQSFVSNMRATLGVRRENNFVASDETEQPLIVNLPPVQLRTYKPFKKHKGDPETQVLLLGDHHAGEITPSYNPDVYQRRLNKVGDSLMTITSLHRNMYPVNDLVIFMGGDMVHGENPKQGAKVGSIACGAQEQIYGLALPALLNLLLSLKQEFKTITVYCVRGNHGRYSRYAPDTSNWDLMLYKALQPLVKPHGIEMIVSDDFNQIAYIRGFKFFAFHGDQIRARDGIPYFALDRKIKSWYFTYHGFNYAVCFHWHKDDWHRVNSEVKAFINGALPSDDPFALEVIGTSSIPTQWTFGVHERVGVTWVYPLILDYAFLPRKEGQ